MPIVCITRVVVTMVVEAAAVHCGKAFSNDMQCKDHGWIR